MTRKPYPYDSLLSAVLLEFPVSVVQRTNLASLEPSRDAVEVEGVLRK